ncbi:hypothetical protein EmuJ_000746400 [Echinococcus multilocularis]|uniref:Uncharacterized protein n=1 Tax=Echinococcus multilocularis TaxID=6211 RepID=A0A068Y551_ECHMU|nr:hypothetical protein EmuJ_000746400 [Echinococcus multilocularis]
MALLFMTDKGKSAQSSPILRISFLINAPDPLSCRRILTCGRQDVLSTIKSTSAAAVIAAADADVEVESGVKASANDAELDSSVTVAITSVTHPSQASTPVSPLTLLFVLLFV